MERVTQEAELGFATADEPLLATIEDLLGEIIVDVEVEPSPFASRAHAWFIDAQLAGGGELSLLLKSTGDEEATHPDKRERDRERRLYADLLADEALPVPRFHGSRIDPSTGRRELLLERLPGLDLRYCGLDAWELAVRRLAQLHRHFAAAPGRVATCDRLLRLDAGYFLAWAERARALAAGVDSLVERYTPVAELLAAQPATLVHNDLAPKNVVAVTDVAPARIAIVDWEMAGVGCGLIDLVTLTYGLEPDEVARMHEAYAEEVSGSDLELEPRVVAAAQLHRTLYRLGHCRSWRVTGARVAEWTRDAERLLAEVAP